MIFIAGISVGLFMAVLFLTKPKKVKQDFLLALWLLMIALHLGYFYFSFYHPFLLTPLLSIVGCGLILIHPAILYLYAFVSTRHQLPAYWFLHLTPYLLFVAVFYFFHKHAPQHFRFEHAFLIINTKEPFLLRQYGIYFALGAGIYTLALVRQTRKHDQLLKNNFSFEEKINLRWLKNWSLLAILFFAISVLLITTSVQSGFPAVSVAFQWIGLTMSVYLFAVGLLGLRQPGVFYKTDPQPASEITNNPNEGVLKEVLITEEAKVRYKKSSLTSEKIENYATQLNQLMAEEMSYLDKELTLSTLAKKLEATPANLSQILNQHYKQNFFDFVNRYRVEEFIIRATDPAFNHLSIFGLASDCGFKSKSSFNKIFKRFTGKNPSYYRVP